MKSKREIEAARKKAAQTKEVVLRVRVDRDFAEKVDRMAEAMERLNPGTGTRSQVIRSAVFHYDQAFGFSQKDYRAAR